MQAARNLLSSESKSQLIHNYEEQLAAQPENDVLHMEVARLCAKLGMPAEALKRAQKALQLNPMNEAHWIDFANIFAQASPDTMDSELMRNVVLALSHHAVSAQSLVEALIKLYWQHSNIYPVLLSFRTTPDIMLQKMMFQPGAVPLFQDVLMQTMMERTFLANWDFEQFFTHARRILLQHAVSGLLTAAEAEYINRFAASLAHQAFNSEYIYWVSDAEETQLASLFEQLSSPSGKTLDAINILKLSIIAAYKPLYDVPEVAVWLTKKTEIDSPVFARLIRRQVTEPLVEANIKKTIKSFSPIQNAVSEHVREQYEESPYPRWISVDLHKPLSFSQYIKRNFPFMVEEEIADRPQMLIAGCGTGMEVVGTAHQFQFKNLLAVDLSTSSIAYGARKVQELGLQNIEFMHGDLLNLKKLGRHFHVISSTGVLHHMQDPMQGWRTLVDILRPGGFMRIGLYSELARTAVVSARDYIRDHAYGETAEEIRRFRHEVMQGNEVPDFALKLAKSRDFYSLSQCRDLMFHRQEHRFTIPELAKCMSELGLEFMGFMLDDRKYIDGYLTKFPDDKFALSLDNWQEYELENPNVFMGMYQFWVRKKAD